MWRLLPRSRHGGRSSSDFNKRPELALQAQQPLVSVRLARFHELFELLEQGAGSIVGFRPLTAPARPPSRTAPICPRRPRPWRRIDSRLVHSACERPAVARVPESPGRCSSRQAAVSWLCIPQQAETLQALGGLFVGRQAPFFLTMGVAEAIRI